MLIQTVSAIPTIDIILIEEDFLTTIIAGSTYESLYQFDNTKAINIVIFFNITNEQYAVSPNETFVKVKLNNNLLDCNEIFGGVFKCEKQNPQVGTNIINVTFTSKINLQPAENYTFQLNGKIRYEEDKVKIEEKIYFEGRGGGGGNLQRDTDRDGVCDWFEEIKGTDPNNPCDPNSECTACLAQKLKQSVQSGRFNETSIVETKITPTSSPTPETSILVVKKPFQWKFIAIPIGIIVAVILFLMWRGREYEDEEYEYSSYSY